MWLLHINRHPKIFKSTFQAKLNLDIVSIDFYMDSLVTPSDRLKSVIYQTVSRS